MEINQLVVEVDRISETTAFNSVKIFAGGSREVTYDTSSSGLSPEQLELVTYLQRSWLEQVEDMLEQYFGITAERRAARHRIRRGRRLHRRSQHRRLRDRYR